MSRGFDPRRTHHFEIMRKAYIEIGEATNAIVKWINSGEYKKMMEATIGDNKDAGFRGACFTLPSVLLVKCNVHYVEDPADSRSLV